MSASSTSTKSYSKEELDLIQNHKGEWIVVPKHGHDKHAHGIEWHTSLGWMIRNRWPFTVIFILVVTILGLALYKKIFPDAYEDNMALLVEMVDRVFGLVLCIVLLVLGVNFFFAPKDAHGKKGGHH